MTWHRSLRSLATTAGVLLTLAVLAIVVPILAGVWGTAALLVVIAISLVAIRFLRRRVKEGTVLEIDLDSGVIETRGSSPVERATSRGAVTLRDVVDALKRAQDDKRITGLVARLGNGGIGLGPAQELRDAVEAFRTAGKRAVAFAECFGEASLATVDYYLACSFDTIYLQPGGHASINGVLARGRFLRNALDKLGITPDLDHRMEYKSAKYMLTETRFIEPHREATSGVAGDQFDQIVEGIAAGRGLDPKKVRELVDGAPIMYREAVDAGLVDHLGYRDEAYRATGGNAFLYHDAYLRKAGRPNRKGKKIALVYASGAITRGKSGFDPLSMGTSLGSDDVARALRLATDDDKVQALVFRVDSPGGSAVGSEVIRREVVRAIESGKPVVVSMGEVAGSGGYWISTDADSIVAQPGTITGSIGVVGGKMVTGDAWRRLGVDLEEIGFGENATFSSSRDVYTDSERARMEASLDSIYEDFIDRVSSGRAMDRDAVREIAKGRIWTGAQARDLGLVDELGGLDKAVEMAKQKAGIPADDTVRITVYPPTRAIPIPKRRDSSEPVSSALAMLLDGIGALSGRATFELRMPGY